MPEYFECQAKYLKQMDNGLIKAAKTLLLVDALSHTEAETKTINELWDNRDLVVATVKRSNIAEVVEHGDSDLWFKCKITYSAQDEDSEKEKKITLYILVNAADVTEAKERAEKHLDSMLVPFQVPKVEETKFSGIVHHLASETRVGPTKPMTKKNSID